MIPKQALGDNILSLRQITRSIFFFVNLEKVILSITPMPIAFTQEGDLVVDSVGSESGRTPSRNKRAHRETSPRNTPRYKRGTACWETPHIRDSGRKELQDKGAT